MENLTAQDVVWLAIFAVIGAMLLCALLAGDEPTPPDLDRTTDEERFKRLRERQKAARQQMKAQGIKSLLDGRPAWRKVVVMGEVPKAKVVPIRRKA